MDSEFELDSSENEEFGRLMAATVNSNATRAVPGNPFASAGKRSVAALASTQAEDKENAAAFVDSVFMTKSGLDSTYRAHLVYNQFVACHVALEIQ